MRPLARGGEAAVHKKFVESNFQKVYLPASCTTKVPALAVVQSAEAVVW
jgi:hypothetical protein